MKREKIQQSINNSNSLPPVLKGLTIEVAANNQVAVTKHAPLYGRQCSASPLPMFFYKPISKL